MLGLGCAAVDDLLYVDSYPPADAKIRVMETARRFGGLTGAALVTAARLGGRCAFAGCLGTDNYSREVADNFVREGVDVSHAPRLAGASVVHSTIVVGKEGASRNIFYEYEGVIGAHDSLPPKEIISSSKVVFLDHLGMKGNLRAARVAREAGVAVVADFEGDTDPLFAEVLELVDHLVLSEPFALHITGQANAADAARALWHPNRAVVIVTSGVDGCWSMAASEQKPQHHPAFRVAVRDTTGCGDVFHGAYAISLARGEPLLARIRFASAAAALKGMSGEIPRLAGVTAFLTDQSRVAA